MRVANDPLFTNASMAGNLASAPIPVNQDFGYSFQLYWTGTAEAGTFQVQWSNDQGVLHPDGTVTGVTNWTDLTGASLTINADGNWGWIDEFANFMWARIIYTQSGGTGTLNGRFCTKGQ